MVVLLAGGYTRRQGLRRIKERLQNVPGASAVRYERRIEVEAPLAFLERCLERLPDRLAETE